MDRRILLSILCFVAFFLITAPNNQAINKHEIIVGGDLIYIDKYPIAIYPHDLMYVYLGVSHFNITIIFFNEGYNSSLIKEKFNKEFGKAGISFSYHFLWYNTTPRTYYISKLIIKMWSYAKEEVRDTQLVLVFTKEYAVVSNQGNNIVIGSAYVEYHVAFVFKGVDNYHRVFVGIHEVGHLLGLVHTGDYNDIMYPEYHGQEHFGEESIEHLRELHG